ncbi:MAG: hypothetical protein KA735_15190 [Burkholderiaceae bacterium]|nr:hypothetical protein [Burkholderiaceae bacterium]
MTPLRQWPVSYIPRDDMRLPGVLQLSSDGQWEVHAAGQQHRLRLLHAWPSFAWFGLSFSLGQHHQQGRGAVRPVRLSVWRHRVSAPAWRALHVLAARQAAMPDRATHKDAP